MLSEKTNNYTVIDIETTGLSPKKNKIIELAGIKIKNDCEVARFSEFVKPDDFHENGYLNYFIRNLTNINDGNLKNARCENDVLKDYLDFIGDDIILGQNIRFDIGFISKAAEEKFGIKFENYSVDTMKLGRKFLKLEKYSLESLANYYNIDYSHAHRALNDCEITNEVYKNLRKFL